MHTLRLNNDKTWTVGLIIVFDQRAKFEPMFERISFGSALQLVNHLNGGNAVINDNVVLRAIEFCAVQKENNA